MKSSLSRIASSLTQRNAYKFASKELLFGNEARNKMLEGCDLLANAVQVTLGPNGRNVLIDSNYGSVKITKDGVTVAKAIEFSDKFAKWGLAWSSLSQIRLTTRLEMVPQLPLFLPEPSSEKP
jgi:chaperonin GroEL